MLLFAWNVFFYIIKYVIALLQNGNRVPGQSDRRPINSVKII